MPQNVTYTNIEPPAVSGESARGKRGRKATSESRAAEIRGRLLAWKQTPESQRISLRALASQMGTSHQLLSFYLRRWDHWQMKEYQRHAQEIPDRTRAENRSMTQAESAQMIAYIRASFHSLAGSIVSNWLARLRMQIKLGKLSGPQVKMARLLARNGCGEAQEILNVHLGKNNLPGTPTGPAKSFGMDTGVGGNSSKTVPPALA